MGEPRKPGPALVVVGVLYMRDADLKGVEARLRPLLGSIHRACEPVPFEWTDYYREEMGPDLKRIFLTGEKLAERDCLADLKRWTNWIEGKLAREDGSRQVNLDPGLLSEENFVLATTKNRGHRIYLRHGIFAEVTLAFHQGRFEAFETTFPDYRSPEGITVFEDIRRGYRQVLKSGSYQVLEEVTW
jgi:hypothetical protein